MIDWKERAPRFKTRALIKIHEPGGCGVRAMPVSNLSVSGLLTRGRWLPPPGSQVLVNLRLDDRVIDCVMQVTRLHSGAGGCVCNDGVYDIGMRFSSLSNTARHGLIQAIVALAEKARHDPCLAHDPVRGEGANWRQDVPAVGVGTTFMTRRTACVMVEGQADRHALWQRSLAGAEVFVVTARPPEVGTELTVSIATSSANMQLRGNVVAVVSPGHANWSGHPPGACVDLCVEGERRRALRRLMLSPCH